jgi:hypothetical protein
LRESLGLNDELVISGQESRDLENPLGVACDAALGARFLRRERYGGARDRTLLRIRERTGYHGIIALAKCSRRSTQKENKKSSSHELTSAL